MTASNKGKQEPQFKSMSAPSTKMIAIVTTAVLVGFILVWIVNDKTVSSDNSATKKTETSNKSDNKIEDVSKTSSTTTSSTTSTTVVVANTQKASTVSVLILNGSKTAGVAKSTSTEVGKQGYKMLTPGDDSSKDTGTFVYYKTGFQPDANKIAKNILPTILSFTTTVSSEIKVEQFPSITPTGWAVTDLLNANVVVVVGNN